MSFMKMTTNRALCIQHAQMNYYRRSIGRKGIKEIRRQTRLPNFHPDKAIDIVIINEHIPRGVNFENLVKKYSDWNDLDLSWYNAIYTGKLYSS